MTYDTEWSFIRLLIRHMQNKAMGHETLNEYPPSSMCSTFGLLDAYVVPFLRISEMVVMQVLHKHLNKSPVNTKDGAQAKIFYIPVYLGRFFNAAWQKYSDPSDAWIINKECHGLDSVACWAEKWIVAENVSHSVFALPSHSLPRCAMALLLVEVLAPHSEKVAYGLLIPTESAGLALQALAKPRK